MSPAAPPRCSPVPKGCFSPAPASPSPRGARRARNVPLGKEPSEAPVPPFQGRGRFVAPQDLHFHTKDWCQKRSDLFFYAKININKRKRNTKKKRKKRRIWGEPGRNQLRPAQLILAVPSAAQPPLPAPRPPRFAASRPPGTGAGLGLGARGNPRSDPPPPRPFWNINKYFAHCRGSCLCRGRGFCGAPHPCWEAVRVPGLAGRGAGGGHSRARDLLEQKTPG